MTLGEIKIANNEYTIFDIVCLIDLAYFGEGLLIIVAGDLLPSNWRLL